MNKTLSSDAKKSLNTLMIVWVTMLSSLGVYMMVCYMIMTQGNFKAPRTPAFLHTPFFMGIDAIIFVYGVAFLLLAFGIIHFKSSYAKLVEKMATQTFETADDAFNDFRKAYANVMFIHMSIFNAISILGVIVFLVTLDFSTLINLMILAAAGYFLVMPNAKKFVL